MSADHLAVTIALRVAIVTTSIAGALAITESIKVATIELPSNVFYGGQTHPNILSGIALLFVSVMWTSIVLSFLLYMSWRIRSAESGAAWPAGFPPPGGPYPGSNSRRQASSTGVYD